MRIVIAPDKFKGSLSAPDVARHLEKGCRRPPAPQTWTSVRIPVADGGEGTLDAAVGSGFTRRSAVVSGPTGPAADGGVCGPRPGGGHRNGRGLRARRPPRRWCGGRAAGFRHRHERPPAWAPAN